MTSTEQIDVYTFGTEDPAHSPSPSPTWID